mmetsp:Transcript_29332/g.57035  ORF Transcript_29332/g.57035 Transcript_29332/m.57035 type:complete len:297 (+) Transcript_29332:2114-3004(+)
MVRQCSRTVPVHIFCFFDVQLTFGPRLHQRLGRLQIITHPEVQRVTGQQHAHSVMNRGHVLVRCTGHRRHLRYFQPSRRCPHIRDRREIKEPAPLWRDPPCRLAPLLPRPFVPAVHRNDGPPHPVKGRLVKYRLRARVDNLLHHRTAPRVDAPHGDNAPTHTGQGPVKDHNLLARSYVMSCRFIANHIRRHAQSGTQIAHWTIQKEPPRHSLDRRNQVHDQRPNAFDNPRNAHGVWVNTIRLHKLPHIRRVGAHAPQTGKETFEVERPKLRRQFRIHRVKGRLVLRPIVPRRLHPY